VEATTSSGQDEPGQARMVRHHLQHAAGPGWQRQRSNWDQVAKKFNITADRYSEFKYLCYLDINDEFVENYVQFHLGHSEPVFTGRLKSSLQFWIELGAPQWLLEYIDQGITIPFDTVPPRLFCKNNVTVTTPDSMSVVHKIIKEYIDFGFVKVVDYIPYCVLPLQLKVTPDKSALIYDMSKLNEYVQQSKFKLESWPEMFDYAKSAEYAVKFDLKKFYHQIQIRSDFQKYFGFRYTMPDGKDTFFVWKTMPYGYTRAPFIAKQLMKPLIDNWRKLGALVVVFYDDGLAVAKSHEFLSQLSLQMQCDLLRAGLVPGANKCIWNPVKLIDWNGLQFDFGSKGIRIKNDRIVKFKNSARLLMEKWPKTTYREVAQCVGRVNSMYPVLGTKVQIKLKMLQTIVNIRNYKNSSWDALIGVDYVPLYFHAYAEIEYWYNSIDSKNFRPFEPPVAKFACWTDASEVALGGCIVPLGPKCPQPLFTIDSILYTKNLKYVQLGKHAALHPDTYPWSQIDKVYKYGVIDSLVESTAEMLICHRNFTPEESATSSTERELLAVYYTIIAAKDLFKGCKVTLHTDSLNSQIICSKGSPKPKLHAYAKLIYDLVELYNIDLEVVWIPRDINLIADYVSNSIDFADYEVVPEKFELLCNTLGKRPDVDFFANSYNAKCATFFSATFEPGTTGINAFNYNWAAYGLGWIFVQPALILRALFYAKCCKCHVLILIPQWKFSYFYPMFLELHSQAFKKRTIFPGKDMFRAGFDATTIFSDRYAGNVEVWEFNFSS
jgi:hypothetical protein